jgi:hypothetical protein
MKRIPKHLTLIPFLLLTIATILLAQAEPQMPRPGPEHQRLHYFVGNWQTELEQKASPMGPGGKVTVTDHNEMLGDFFVVFHRDERGPTESGKEIGIMGYDSSQKVYTYEHFDDNGDVGRAITTISGDTWVFLWPATDDCKDGGKQQLKGRITLKEVSPTSYTFVNEISIDGGPWTKLQEAKATKK